MHDWLLYSFLIILGVVGAGILICFVYICYLGRRALRLFEKVQHAWRKEVQSAPWVPSTTPSTTSQERSEAKTPEIRVAELPPEVIAPHIRRPPKSSGFGGVGGGDGDEQRQSDSGKEENPAPPTATPPDT